MTKAITFMVVIFFLSCSTDNVKKIDPDFKFHTSNEIDHDFLYKRKSFLVKEMIRISDYYNFSPPFDSPFSISLIEPDNTDTWSNCGRIRLPNEIVAYSPTTLSNARQLTKNKINPYCFTLNYEDLFYTILHEYSHLLVLQKYPLGFSKWLWESSSIVLSNELKSDRLKLKILTQLKTQASYNLCVDNLSLLNPYLQVGPILAYYESKSPGLIREMLELASEEKLSIKKMFEKKKISCTTSKNRLITFIKNY